MDDIDNPRRTSAVWKHFTRKPNYVASCNVCKKVYSYKATVSNLSKHWKKKHSKYQITNNEHNYSNFSDDDDSSNSDTSNNKNTISKVSETNSTWQYFDILDDDSFVVRCKICKKDISYETMTDLTYHAREHNVTVSDDEDWVDSRQRRMKKQFKRANASSVWRFMDIVDEKTRVAVCLICQKQLSYVTSISNLRKHVQKMHPHIIIDDDLSDNTDKQVIISTDGQLYEIATPDVEKDPVATNEVYVEETIDNHISDNDNKTPLKRLKILDKKSIKRKKVSNEQSNSYNRIKIEPVDDSSNDDSCNDDRSSKRTSKENSIEIFGQYIVTLLKELPKPVSDKLQSDIIKQIFSAKIPIDSVNHETVTVNKNNSPNTRSTDRVGNNTSDIIKTSTTDSAGNKTDVIVKISEPENNDETDMESES